VGERIPISENDGVSPPYLLVGIDIHAETYWLNHGKESYFTLNHFGTQESDHLIHPFDHSFDLSPSHYEK